MCVFVCDRAADDASTNNESARYSTVLHLLLQQLGGACHRLDRGSSLAVHEDTTSLHSGPCTTTK